MVSAERGQIECASGSESKNIEWETLASMRSGIKLGPVEERTIQTRIRETRQNGLRVPGPHDQDYLGEKERAS